jgi:hypothetical protein
MKKLEEIPKIDIFKAPEGYFDKLPGIIQARVQKPESAPVWRPVVRFALPALAVVIAVFFFWPGINQTPEEVLASIDDNHLIAYLEENDLNTDELLDGVSINNDEADAIQENTMKEVNMLNDEEYLSTEFTEDYF